MSNVTASYMSLFVNTNNSTSTTSATGTGSNAFSDLLNTAENSLSGTSGGQGCGLEALLSITDQSSGDQSGSANSADAGGNFSQIFALLQEVVTDMENMLDQIDPGNGASATASATTTTDTSVAATSVTGTSTTGNSALTSGLSAGAMELMGEGGPLPTFLNGMDAEAGLSTPQEQSLWNIAAENTGNGTPDVNTIRSELAQAGIPDTVPANLLS